MRSAYWKGRAIGNMSRTELLELVDEIDRYHRHRFIGFAQTVAESSRALRPVIEEHGDGNHRIALLKMAVQARCIAATPSNDGTECGRRQGDAT